jgi:hypothetical protein
VGKVKDLTGITVGMVPGMTSIGIIGGQLYNIA